MPDDDEARHAAPAPVAGLAAPGSTTAAHGTTPERG
ncbi:hypothetical protein FHX71_000054 [Promicromonospora sukumoe]|uniref:Uncharacterized protein n=1 Tax=Promicromonospora sukumoe TaxID=88382 RepID=A0A7W3PC34_9MICO|nr:hypothetical protein [Promicromonospora sukumoe]